MKRLVLLVAMLVMIACTNDGSKVSIVDPLSDKQLEKAIEKNPEFEELYQLLSLFRKSVANSQVDKVKYSKVTYGDLYKYEEFTIDEAKVKAEYAKAYPQKDELKQKAQEKLDNYLTFIPSNLMEIEFSKVSRRYSSYYYYFDITPLKGSISDLRFDYILAPKSAGYKSYSEASSDVLSNNQLIHGTVSEYGEYIQKFSAYDYNYSVSTDSDAIITDSIKTNYDVFYKVSDFTFEGKKLRDIPYSVQQVVLDWDNVSQQWQDDPSLKDNILDEIIKNKISSTYKSYPDFYSEKLNAARVEKFPKLSEVIEDIALLTMLGLFN